VPAWEIVWLDRRVSATFWMLWRSDGMTDVLREGFDLVGRRSCRVL
jgi:hypothetical protein